MRKMYNERHAAWEHSSETENERHTAWERFLHPDGPDGSQKIDFTTTAQTVICKTLFDVFVMP